MASNDRVSRGSKDAESEKARVSARKSIEARKDFEYGNLKLENEFYTLGLIFPAERLDAVRAALKQIRPRNRFGPNPPDNISSGRFGGNLLYAFVWPSPQFGLRMYLKFCLTIRNKEEVLVLFSFHIERPRGC